MQKNLYHYKAIITSVYDGDTCTANIDLGFKFYHNGLKLRLANIDAPEVRGDTLLAGQQSREFLRDLILNKEVIVMTEKDSTEKYGRYIAHIYLTQEDGTYMYVNEQIVLAGHAIYKAY